MSDKERSELKEKSEKSLEILNELYEQAKNQVEGNRITKKILIKHLKTLIDGIPDYPFYDKYKAIIAKTMIDIQYLT